MKHLYNRLLLCSFLMALSIQLAGQIVISSQVTQTGCGAICTGKIGLIVSGGLAPYLYNWSNGLPQIPEVENLCVGTYTVTVTDANGATQTASASVTETTTLNLSLVSNSVSCNGMCDGSINLTVVGGQTPYSFAWSTGANTEDIAGICAGTYLVTVFDGSGCKLTATATVSEPPPFVLSICATPATCYGGSNGSIDLFPTGGVPQYTYLWSNGSTTQDLTNLTAGTYTPTVIDGNGCTAIGNATVTQPTPITINSAVTNSSNGNNNGIIDLTITGGSAPYTYDWSNDGPENPDNDPQDLSGLPVGTNTVTVTDSHGCQTSQSFTVQGNGGSGTGQIVLDGQVINSGCGTNCTGSISLTVSGGSGNFSLHWTAPNGYTSTQTNISNLCPGTYCVFVVDSTTGIATEQCFTVGQALTQDLEIQSSNAAFCNYNDGTNPPTCEMVCPHTTITYFVEPPVNCSGPSGFQGATWTVSGAESYTVNPNGKEVVVTWGEAGPGLLTLTSSNPDLCFISNRCITIVEEPVAKFSTDPPVAANTTLQLCKGQTVSFLNESLNAEQFEWLFSDNLTTSTEQHTQHTFLTPGNFTVTLIARSNCLCADTTVMLVEVLDSEPPLLDCVGSVCPGETVQYSTSSNCSSYNWVVSANGTVVDGGNANDNSITIEWGQGPVGTIALSASGCGGAACPQASLFTISIISDNADIRGEEFVCTGSEETYTIDQFDGTEYSWSLTSGGSILNGQGTNKVTVAWTAPPNPGATHWLIVDYYNCYLGCGGQDSIPVVILSPFFIQGSVEKCENAPSGFSAVLSPSLSSVNCNWVIYQENGTTFWTSASASSILNFPTNAPPGKYRIRALPATPGQTCSFDAELVVSVVARPSKPAFIDGPTVICPGAPLTYEVLGNDPFSVEWKVNNGTPAAQMGNPVNVTWNTNANRWLSATFISTDGLGCKSDSNMLNVSAVTVLSITGAPSMCEGAVGYYVADQYEDFTYAWEILPASAGAVKSGQGTNAVEIFWQTPGNHQLRVTTCGLSTVFNVTVWPNPEPVIVQPNGVCPGDSGLVLTAVPYIAYDWQIADGNSVSTVATALIPAGSYAVTVTDVHGCKGSSDFKIDLYPTPNVSVTTADPTGFCNNSAYVSITALVPDEGNFTFEWLHDGTPVGSSTPVYVTNQYGQFTTVVTNQYGCKATAPPILLYNYCLGGGGGYCPNPPHPPCPLGNVQAVPDPTSRCDSIALVLNDYTGNYVPGSAQWWTGISGGVQIATASGDNASFIYPNAGKYIVIVSALMQNGSICDAIDSIDIEAVAQFSQRLACPGDSTRFIDESTRLPEANIAAWQWDFGEAGTGDTSTDDSPGYPYANAGNYTAMLTITTASGCTSTYAENVFVPNFPTPAFTPPLANCAGNASAFALANPAGLVETTWDFGDPASGALNQSAGNPVYHNYSPAGNYPVTITATNAFGCTASTTHPVTITANPFTGNITPVNAVICEGQTITLVAPSGANASYVWSDGTNLPILIVDHEGVYDVTLTNGNGCTYSPPSKTVDVNPAPVGVIKALELNDLGQVTGVSYPTVAVCAGEDVNLEIQDNGTYTYQWSGGNGTNEVLIFSEDRDNLLTIGTYTYTVTVTNPTTGCTTVFAPFEVTVNPVPAGFSLATNNVCAGTPSTITYFGQQQPTWQVYWNTGETGPAITTEDAGLYFVRVVNEFGCAAQSNTVVIFPGPNVAALPAGCHERCNPDTLCLPAMPDIVSWQWYFEGNAIPGATTSQFAATQSGTYYAELIDLNGCQAQSADLTVELYDGFGNILGHVWSDVNHNGVVDAADTLVALIPVQLWQNGTLVTGNISGQSGDFEWLNVLATGYTVQIDTQSLSAIWEVVIPSDSVGLSGCGGKVFADLLVDAYTCPPTAYDVVLTACPGTSATYNGTSVLAGQSQIFNIPGPLGCDSIVTVTVNPLPISTSTLQVSTCPGTTFNYQGINLSVGQTQDFTLTSTSGCDSIVTVIVGALPTSASTLNVSTCPGTTYNYLGINLSVGQMQNFTLTNAIGCDSIVTVVVGALPTSASTLNVSTCPGDTYSYQGVNLSVGQMQDFTLTNAIGCDSIVTVVVGALPTSASTLNVSTCPGDTYSYQGANLSVGQTQDFTLTNAVGCDSIVTVIVGALPTSIGTASFGVCPGETQLYQGQALPVGTVQDFTLSNWLGCDSIVTVTVTALSTSTGTASFGVCPNETYLFEGQTLSVGTVQDFTLTNWLGCDSIVTVTIYEKATSAEIRDVTVCPGQTYQFNGQTIAIGEVRDVHFTNSEDCDSLITIRVAAWPSLDYTLATEPSCPTTGTGVLDITLLPGGSLPVGYALNGGTYQADTRFEALSDGNYTVSVQDENGCIFEKTATVLASPNLDLALPGAFVIPCDSVLITLAPALGGDTTGLKLTWWNGAQAPAITTGEAGSVWLEATNHCNETIRKDAEVVWADSDGEPINIYVPNIFAPDARNVENTMFRAFIGDNLNLLDYRLEVYDRWGNMLFESEQPEIGWTGPFRNKNVEPGVYVWQLWVKVTFCGREMELYRNGDVTVER